jgi:hypothetical protein
MADYFVLSEIIPADVRIMGSGAAQALADCLVPKWAGDELTRDFPCARQPSLHRIFADCPPDTQRILSLAGRYGLLTVSIPRPPAPGQILRASALPPEPVEIWRKEIQALRPARNCGIRLRTVGNQEQHANGSAAKSPSTWRACHSTSELLSRVHSDSATAR